MMATFPKMSPRFGEVLAVMFLVVSTTAGQGSLARMCSQPQNRHLFTCLMLNIHSGIQQTDSTARPATTSRPPATRRTTTTRPATPISRPQNTRRPPTGTPDLQLIRSELNTLLNGNDRLIAAWVQLGFHSCVGGCDGCLDTTLVHNKGLKETYSDLRDAHRKHVNSISLADFLALAAIQAAQKGLRAAGNSRVNIRFRLGRRDCANPDQPDKRAEFPEGDDPHALDQLVKELGITRRQAVALLGAHSLGRCHTDNTGFEGAWDSSENKLDNGYYRSLAGTDWVAEPTPNRRSTQWNSPAHTRMMLHADMALWKSFDVRGSAHVPTCLASKNCTTSADAHSVRLYANSEFRFHRDFAEVFAKMLENTASQLRDP